MFEYHSEQTHSEFIKGKGMTKTHRVTIKGKKGYKLVELKNKSGKITQKSKKALTKKEISCIKRCEFIPGLFKDCERCITYN